jgi:hypothetical protein
MIIEIAAVLIVICALRMLCRLLARRGDVSYYVSTPVDPRHGSGWADTVRSDLEQRPTGLDEALLDARQSSAFCRNHPHAVRTERQRVGAGESTCSDGSELTRRQAQRLHGPERRMFQPCKRPSLGLAAEP